MNQLWLIAATELMRLIGLGSKSNNKKSIQAAVILIILSGSFFFSSFKSSKSLKSSTNSFENSFSSNNGNYLIDFYSSIFELDLLTSY